MDLSTCTPEVYFTTYNIFLAKGQRQHSQIFLVLWPFKNPDNAVSA